MPELPRDELHHDIDATLDDAERKNQENERVNLLESRLAALEGKPDTPGFDASPITARIDGLENNINRLVGIVESRLTGAPEAEHKTEAAVTPPEPETPPEQPKVVTQTVSETEFREWPPKQSHPLFWRRR